MTAREFFCSARDAAQRLNRFESTVEAKAQLAVMKARSEGPTSRGGVTDPMKRVDDLMDYRSRFEREQSGDRALVARANEILVGYSHIDLEAAEMLRMRYISEYGGTIGVPWAVIGFIMGCSYSELRTIEGVAFERMDSEGLSAIARGRLRITGAEDAPTTNEEDKKWER